MTLFQGFGVFASSGAKQAFAFEKIIPTSVTAASGTATISATGRVNMSGVSACFVNGVFSADYDNYMLITYGGLNSTLVDFYLRMSSNGVNDETANYNYGQIDAENTTVARAAGVGASNIRIGKPGEFQNNHMITQIQAPFLAQPTIFQSFNVHGSSNGAIYDSAGVHNVSSSFDGFRFFVSSRTFTGSFDVYGYRNEL